MGPAVVDAKVTYDAFGNQTLTGGVQPTTHASTIGYRGQLVDRATKQVYLRNRFYSPDIGRFTRPDPARAGHAYAYAYAASGANGCNEKLPHGVRADRAIVQSLLHRLRES